MKVFFTGAGASKGTFHSTGTPVPVAAEFGKVLQDIDPQWPFHYPALFKIVEHLDLPLANWGLEPVWTCMDYYAKLQEAIPQSSAWSDESPQMKKALLEVYGKRCDDAADQLPLTDGYTLGGLVKNEMNPGDIIISFNYDTIVERLACRFGHTLLSVNAQEQNRKKGITLAKPHGSTSWTLDLDKIIRGSPQCVIAAGENDGVLLNSLKPTDVDNRREPLVLGAVPIKSELIREVQVQLQVQLRRSRPVFDTIVRQWRTVVEAIRDADSVVVVGYSFPQEDEYGRFLLQEGMRLRNSRLSVEFFELQNKKCEREKAIQSAFDSRIENLFYRGKVEAY
ncbi:MAG: hypothetical protein OXC18_09990 [Desulfurellaceae bacterium]|nr:hypothetical protein [Desulfurellaceae bacterium]